MFRGLLSNYCVSIPFSKVMMVTSADVVYMRLEKVSNVLATITFVNFCIIKRQILGDMAQYASFVGGSTLISRSSESC
jgi:hypothetical protein